MAGADGIRITNSTDCLTKKARNFHVLSTDLAANNIGSTMYETEVTEQPSPAWIQGLGEPELSHRIRCEALAEFSGVSRAASSCHLIRDVFTDSGLDFEQSYRHCGATTSCLCLHAVPVLIVFDANSYTLEGTVLSVKSPLPLLSSIRT